jgi:hypothetical protein
MSGANKKRPESQASNGSTETVVEVNPYFEASPDVISISDSPSLVFFKEEDFRSGISITSTG